MSEPDLFVVCKNCSSEVSPYVTECPYCGQRVRKRAPKIERNGSRETATRPRRPRAPTLPRLRRGEIPGIAPETRPYATGLLIFAVLALYVVAQAANLAVSQVGGLVGPISGDAWRVVTTPFVTTNLGVATITLVCVGIFGMHIERRFGPAVVVVIFLLSGAAGAALSAALGVYPALSANGAALGLLSAWFVDDRLALRRGDDRGNDLLGVAVLALLLVLLPLADTSVSFFAGIGGAAAGAIAGALISPLRR